MAISLSPSLHFYINLLYKFASTSSCSNVSASILSSLSKSSLHVYTEIVIPEFLETCFNMEDISK